MEDFLKAIWTDDFIVKDKTENKSPVFLGKEKKQIVKKEKSEKKKENIIKSKLDKENKELKLQWYKENDEPGYSFIYKGKDGFYYKFFCKRIRFINSFIKKNKDNIEVSHYRPIVSRSQAQVVANRKWKRYKTTGGYILSDEFFALLCTYTK